MLKSNIVIFFICVLFSVTVDAQRLSDPTKPKHSFNTSVSATTDSISTKKKHSLNAIKVTDRGNIAIINNQQYRTGSKLGQDTIIKISSNKVLLSSGKKMVLFADSVIKLSSKD
ncbi:hypothetical protein [Psychrobium sp. 1_MG-2023]|uniref:hypothetical protein n=1 Tax=Psychrobium sp. 1_MG-2023 TaxID=3062624 RepID=UPI000C345918|nr:hypothetical protein [Psychrobium sp. 1_MG-2023]MDP2560866.1 hypothetical protein [Psychrobium sp. 1_MG-2023]PKF56739.1 hypothetical protein CW748_09690 [Alteromonadales bacterium alter-6D02]